MLSNENLAETMAAMRANPDDAADLARLERALSQAKGIVASYVKMVPETLSDDDLIKALKDSGAGSVKGDPDKRTHVLIMYFQQDAGESSAQPKLRVPPLRSRGAHLQRLVHLAMNRHGAEFDKELHPQDIYLISDAGKEGNKNLILGAFTVPDSHDPAAGGVPKQVQVKKSVRRLTTIWSEQSLANRLEKVRGSGIQQSATLYQVSRMTPTVNLHDRLYTPNSTNRGNVLGPYDCEDWETSDTGLKVQDSFTTHVFDIKI